MFAVLRQKVESLEECAELPSVGDVEQAVTEGLRDLVGREGEELWSRAMEDEEEGCHQVPVACGRQVSRRIFI